MKFPKSLNGCKKLKYNILQIKSYYNKYYLYFLMRSMYVKYMIESILA